MSDTSKLITKKPAKLTKEFVESTNEPGIYPDIDLKGFRLRVAISGVKSYQFVGRVKGRPEKVFCTIGTHGQIVSAKVARERAIRLKLQMADGIHPNEKAKAERESEEQARIVKGIEELTQTLTFGLAFEEFLDTKKQKDSTQKIYRLVVGKHFKDWIEKPLVDISQEDVLKRYSDIAEESQSSAAHAMRIFRAVFHTAQVKHGETIHQLIRLNPVKLLTHARKKWNTVKEREEFIHDEDLKSFYAALVKVKSETVRDYILVCLMTGLRKSEACTLKWGENVDMRNRTITVSSTQAKNNQQHVLVMSDYLYELFMRRWNTAGKNGEYVFPGRSRKGHLNDPEKHIRQMVKETGIVFSSHSLRRTFATNLDALGFDLREVQRLLNHKPGSVAERHYIQRQAEKTREPMQRVSERLLSLMGVEYCPSNVVLLAKSS